MIKKTLKVSSFTIIFSLVSLYSYILVFYIKFKTINKLDPKDLNLPIVYESIKLLHMISLLLAMIMPVVIIGIFIKKYLVGDLKNFGSHILQILLCTIFLLISYFDFNNYIFWFFD